MFSPIIQAAITDIQNPCAISVMVLIFMILFEITSPKRALFNGLIYTLVIFVVYFSLSLGIFSSWFLVQYYVYFHLFIIISLFLIGLKALADFILKPEILHSIYGVCATNRLYAKIVAKLSTFTGAIFLGLVSAIFLLPCSGGAYFYTALFLSNGYKTNQLLPNLLRFSGLFLLPFIMVTFLTVFILWIIQPTKLNKDTKYYWLLLVKAFIFIGLGIWLLFL